MTLSVRSTLPEEMDDEDVDIASYQRCLSELDFINRITFTHRPTLHWLARATRHLPPGATFSVLDVAYGHGDLLRAIARWANKRGLNAQLSGIDLNPRSAASARAATPRGVDIDYQTGDVFAYAPPTLVDFIVSSQFTHHLTDRDVVKFLTWLEENSQCGWHIADLQRHPVPYYSFQLLAHLMGWHRIVRSDGTISIARSFRRGEWQTYLDIAGLKAQITWHTAFRLCVSRIHTKSWNRKSGRPAAALALQECRDRVDGAKWPPWSDGSRGPLSSGGPSTSRWGNRSNVRGSPLIRPLPT